MKHTVGSLASLIGSTILFIFSCHAQWIHTNVVSGGSVKSMAVRGANVYAGSDTIYHSSDNGLSWVSISPGFHPAVLAAVSRGGDSTTIFACNEYIFHSTDNGVDWDTSIWLPNISFKAIAVSGSRIYFGFDDFMNWGVILTPDLGTTWGYIGHAIPGGISCFAVSHTWSGDTNLFAGTTNGIFYSTDNGYNWTLQNTLPFNAMTVKGTTVFGGNSHGVYLSSDNGSNWSAVNNGLTDTLVNAFVVNGKNVFAGTNGGVFLSTNDGTNWNAVNTGLTDSIVFSLAVKDSFLFAGTDSTGVWRRPLSEIVPKVNIQADISNGWNLVSVPIKVTDYSKTTLFPSAKSEAFAYKGNYMTKDTLSIGSGYWVRFDHNQTVSMSGDFIASESIAVVQGWNLVGSFGDSVPVSMIGSNVPGMITSNFFGYQNGYIVTDSILPGNGYWVNADTDGYLIFRSDNVSPVANRIQIVPSDELPPQPIEGMSPQSRVPSVYALSQSWPNPFNPTTTIQYQLSANSKVTLKVYNLLGEITQILADGIETAGFKRLEWNASNFASGVYFYRLNAVSLADPKKTFTQVKKMILIR